jgi:hypothetical protein
MAVSARQALQPYHAQELEAVVRLRARAGGVDDQPLVVLGAEHDLAVEFQRADDRVLEAFDVGAAYGDIVGVPQRRELLAAGAQSAGRRARVARRSATAVRAPRSRSSGGKSSRAAGSVK